MAESQTSARTDDASRDNGAGGLVLTASGLAAAFGCAACCGLPMLLASAGFGSAWLAGFAMVAAPHRPLLLVIGAIGLTGGALLFWRQNRLAVCRPASLRPRPAIRYLTMAGLLVGAGLLYLGYTYA